jgi:hypothetical protein
MKKLIDDITIYLVIIVVFLISFVSFVLTLKKHQIYGTSSTSKIELIGIQPPIREGVYPWSVRSVDTQVVSKHWPNVTRSAVREQVAMIKKTGVNYIAIGTPYDRVEDLTKWAEEIHAAGLNVWFRCHWAQWEGDEGLPGNMTTDEYLTKTKKFIINNPKLFREGDSFTVAVEAEQVGVGLGKKFLTWNEYHNFLISEVETANEAFGEIGLEGKVHTNWLSMNGWVVENQITPELANQLGIVVVDHFVGQSNSIGVLSDPDAIVDKTVSDLDRYHTELGVPILLGEWGYQIYQDVDESTQALVVSKLFDKLKTKPYLVGVNYWVHMGNSAAIISDEYGMNLKYKRAAEVIRSYYDPTSEMLKFEQ